MGKKVYANGMEIVQKAGAGKVIAAFPDVCLSPPSPPAGPVPLPYPDTSKSNDLKDGTKGVKIGGKPAGHEDSYYKTSPLGDESATKSFGGSVLTHGITGKTYFAAHSMDVTMEGKHVVRHVDLTTSNHRSYPGGTPPFPNLSSIHKEALQAVEEGKCPCCKSGDCPAAFQEGEEPLSMKEAMGMEPGRSNYSPKKRQALKEFRYNKKKFCTCSGKVFPSPPCDVFREPNKQRHDAIEDKWNRSRRKYIDWYEANYGVRLKRSGELLDLFMASFSAADQRAMKATTTLPRAERAQNKFARTYSKMSVDANKLERINHLTPKEYGGCPDNPDNLQPQQTLCVDCQEIDQMMTDLW